jgi:hypothetical protein
MAFTTKQLFQARENSTNAVSVFSPAANQEVEITRIVFANTTTSEVFIRLFNDDNGTTYDESTALIWDLRIPAGAFFPYCAGVDMSDSTGNLAYRSSVANAVTITGYGSVTT